MAVEDTRDKFNGMLADIQFPGYVFTIHVNECHCYLQAWYMDDDIHTGRRERQTTRKWLLSPHMVKGEVVQTAFKCVMTSMEHRVREDFLYKGRRIFGPHFDLDELVKLCDLNAVEHREAMPK